MRENKQTLLRGILENLFGEQSLTISSNGRGACVIAVDSRDALPLFFVQEDTTIVVRTIGLFSIPDDEVCLRAVMAFLAKDIARVGMSGIDSGLIDLAMRNVSPTPEAVDDACGRIIRFAHDLQELVNACFTNPSLRSNPEACMDWFIERFIQPNQQEEDFGEPVALVM
jgi:hypothetical protein